MRRTIAAALLALSLLTGCAGMKIEDFANTTPRFRVEEFFLGRTTAWGIFENRFGELKREFKVDIVGAWEGDRFVLTEDFVYSDGETERRVWRIRATGPDTYEGEAEGVVGVARGVVAGKALHWIYDFDLKAGGRTWRVRFDDWMFLQDPDTMVNRARVMKWGFEVGQASIFFRREAAAAARPAARDAAE